MDHGLVLERIKEWAAQLWKLGMVEHPLFTLHGPDHSGNILNNLEKIVSAVKPFKELNSSEWFCLKAAVLLHDLGMLYNYEQLMLDLGCTVPSTKRQQLNTLNRFISQYADQRYADELKATAAQKLENQSSSTADLMRTLHATISFYLVVKYKEQLGITENQIYHPIAIIARSHTGVRLPLHDSESTSMVGISPVRTSFLSALLALADEVDFFGSRVPDEVFHFYANRVVADTRALIHWIKHYYVNGVEFGRESYETANKLLVRIHADVPDEQSRKLMNSFLEDSSRKLTNYGLADAISRDSEAGSILLLPNVYVTPTAKPLPKEIFDHVTIMEAAGRGQPYDVQVQVSQGNNRYCLTDFPDNIPGKWVVVAGDRRDDQRNVWTDILAQGGSVWDVCRVISLNLPSDTIVIGDKYPELIKHLLSEEKRNILLVGSPSCNLLIRELHGQHHMGVYRFAIDETLFDEEHKIIANKEFLDKNATDFGDLIAEFQGSEYISPWKHARIPATPRTGVYNGFVGLAEHPYYNDRVAIVAGGTKSYSTIWSLAVLSSSKIAQYPLGATFRVTIGTDLAIGLNAYKGTRLEWLEQPYDVQDVEKQLVIPEVSRNYGDECGRLLQWLKELADVRQR